MGQEKRLVCLITTEGVIFSDKERLKYAAKRKAAEKERKDEKEVK